MEKLRVIIGKVLILMQIINTCMFFYVSAEFEINPLEENELIFKKEWFSRKQQC
jgi:hypothetical protein